MTKLEAVEMLAQAHKDDQGTLGAAARKVLAKTNRQRQLINAINKLVEAEIDFSWKGGDDPAGWPETDKNLKEAKARLDKIINIVFYHEA